MDTAVLVDGLRLRDAAALHGDASGLIQDLLFTDWSRVEVMNGAGSSLYGTNAIGGVLNILTDEGGGRTRGSVLAEGGSLGTMRGRAQMAGAAVGNRLQYSGGLAYVNVLSGVDGDDPFTIPACAGALAYRLSGATQLHARVFCRRLLREIELESAASRQLTGQRNYSAPFPLSISAGRERSGQHARREVPERSAEPGRAAAGEAELFVVVSDAGLQPPLRRRAGGRRISAPGSNARFTMGASRP